MERTRDEPSGLGRSFVSVKGHDAVVGYHWMGDDRTHPVKNFPPSSRNGCVDRKGKIVRGLFPEGCGVQEVSIYETGGGAVREGVRESVVPPPPAPSGRDPSPSKEVSPRDG